ncbi:hypothetical protein NY78_0457 [Desulfovibrio sp. TomC]|nr:hypothetical protein NY78_0457 [Desulfovibrio sp. TomC]
MLVLGKLLHPTFSQICKLPIVHNNGATPKTRRRAIVTSRSNT